MTRIASHRADPRLWKTLPFFRGERGCGNDNAVEGQQRQALAVEDRQNFVEGFCNLPGIRRTELSSGGMQKLYFLQQVTVHIASRL